MRFAVCIAMVSSSICAAEPGLYEIEYLLEMPHLERYAQPRRETRCLGEDLPMPVMSGNGAFAECAVLDARRDGPRLSYRLECAGASGARAEAFYRLSDRGFEGRIAVKLGAKNMTLQERQTARRIGDCPPSTVEDVGQRD